MKQSSGLFSIDQLAKIFHWTTRRTRRRMTGMGLAFKQGKRWYVTAYDLQTQTPKLWNEIAATLGARGVVIEEYEGEE